MSFNCQFTTKMVVISSSCICQSANKKFRIVALENLQFPVFVCENDSKIATNLETQDYEALGFCQPPVMDQYYSIGLRLPHINSTSRAKCNTPHPYFWRTRRNEEIVCVDGSPLELPRNFDGDRRCNLASVLPGSLSQIYNAAWTRCNSVQYAICQLERNASITDLCKDVSPPTATTTISRTTVTTAATKAATTTITALSNKSTAIIIGSVLGVLVILFLVLLLHLFQKKNKTKRNASKKRNHKIAVQK